MTDFKYMHVKISQERTTVFEGTSQLQQRYIIDLHVPRPGLVKSWIQVVLRSIYGHIGAGHQNSSSTHYYGPLPGKFVL